MPTAGSGSPPLKVPGLRAIPEPANGTRLQVDDFPDGLVPFVGDPKRSRMPGDLLQILCGLAAMTMVLFVVPNAVVVSLARKGDELTMRDIRRMAEAWRLIDDLAPLSLVGVLSVVALVVLFVRSRRPRNELAEKGEAFVEVALARICPRPRAIAIGTLGAIGVATALVPTSPLDGFDAIARAYAAKGIGLACLAVALVLVLQLGRASRQHLERRLAVSVGLAPDDAPFVAPDTRAARDAVDPVARRRSRRRRADRGSDADRAGKEAETGGPDVRA